jgi:hypothetical protein
MTANTGDLTVTIEGRRAWVSIPFGHQAKEAVKAAGAKWDPDSKRWWVGSGKADALRAAVRKGAEAPPKTPEELTEGLRVHFKARYKGREYYAVAESQTAYRLLTLDASLDFWADRSACEVVRRYEARQVGRGRYQQTVYTTLGSIRDFKARQANPATARGECTECGSWGPKGEPCRDCGGEGHHA